MATARQLKALRKKYGLGEYWKGRRKSMAISRKRLRRKAKSTPHSECLKKGGWGDCYHSGLYL